MAHPIKAQHKRNSANNGYDVLYLIAIHNCANLWLTNRKNSSSVPYLRSHSAFPACSATP